VEDPNSKIPSLTNGKLAIAILFAMSLEADTGQAVSGRRGCKEYFT